MREVVGGPGPGSSTGGFALVHPMRTELGKLWASAFDGFTIRHPDPGCAVGFELREIDNDCPSLFCWASVRDSRDPNVWRERQAIHSARLTYWPGIAAARAWLAVGWTGYMIHESLECCRDAHGPVLDPHAEPYDADFVFRRAMPSSLTPETLRAALLTLLPPHAVDAICG